MTRKNYARIRLGLQALIFWAMPLMPVFDVFWWQTGWFMADDSRGPVHESITAAMILFLLIVFLNWAAVLKNHAEEAKDDPGKAVKACFQALFMLGIATLIVYIERAIFSDIWSQIQKSPDHPKSDPFGLAHVWLGAWLLLVGYSLKAYWDEAVRAFASLHKKHLSD